MAALDTNVLLRLLMRDDLEPLASAQRLINERLAAGETLFVPVSVALELERVHRSRFELDKAAVLRLFSQQRGLLRAVALVVDRGAVGRPNRRIGLPADG